MIGKIFAFLILGTLLLSCDNNKYLLFMGEDLTYGNYKGDARDTLNLRIEVDSATIYNNKDTFANGNFYKGVRKGMWHYEYENYSFDFDWDYGKVVKHDLIINYPKGWSPFSYPDYHLVIAPDSNLNVSNFFIKKYELEELDNMDFKEFYCAMFNKMRQERKIEKVLATYDFDHNKRLHYYQEIQYKELNQIISQFSFIFLHFDSYYVCNYRTKNIDLIKDRIVFSEIIKSLRKDNERILDPFMKSKKNIERKIIFELE